jgi:predicted  nucleic acid-binding Zn-ribbon protein
MPDKDKLKKLRKEVDVLYKKATELDKTAVKAWNAYEKTNDKFQDLKAKLLELEDDYDRP